MAVNSDTLAFRVTLKNPAQGKSIAARISQASARKDFWQPIMASRPDLKQRSATQPALAAQQLEQQLRQDFDEAMRDKAEDYRWQKSKEGRAHIRSRSQSAVQRQQDNVADNTEKVIEQDASKRLDADMLDHRELIPPECVFRINDIEYHSLTFSMVIAGASSFLEFLFNSREQVFHFLETSVGAAVLQAVGLPEDAIKFSVDVEATGENVAGSDASAQVPTGQSLVASTVVASLSGRLLTVLAIVLLMGVCLVALTYTELERTRLQDRSAALDKAFQASRGEFEANAKVLIDASLARIKADDQQTLELLKQLRTPPRQAKAVHTREVLVHCGAASSPDNCAIAACLCAGSPSLAHPAGS